MIVHETALNSFEPALRLVKWTLKLCGVEEAATALANANTLDEQQAVWDAEIKPILLSKACQRIFESPAFMWNALGVPRNQGVSAQCHSAKSLQS